IRTLLQRSADAWNRGDLDGFLEPYLRSDRTTYIGSTGLRRGFDALRESYRAGYFASGPPEDRLEFDDIDVRTLGDSHALAIGRYRLVDRESGETTDEGIYSLTLLRTDAGWRIIHDHSSSLSGG
ncbi:MAG: YybH family protein, partial [Longimicrobiales bacterium]